MSDSGFFRVDVAGTPLPDDVAGLLAQAYVEDSLHLPAAFVLRFRDPGRLVITKSGATIGTEIKISVQAGAAAAPKPLIDAEITALEAEYDAGGSFTVIRGFDASHRLHRGRRTEAYAQATASDVARKVASRAGLTVGTIQSTTTVFEHLCQGAETDREFLGRLARESGCEIGVTDGKFDFRKPRAAADAPAANDASSDPLVLRLGTDLLRVQCAVTSAEQVKEVEVRGWDVAAKQALVGTKPAATTGAQLSGVAPAALAKAFGNAVYVSTDVPYGTQSEVDTAAGAVAEEIAGAFAQVEGLARGNVNLRAGAAVALLGLGAPFDGKYMVTTSRHRYDAASGYTTVFTVTGRQDRSLFGLTGGGGRPGRGASGVVVGSSPTPRTRSTPAA